MNLKIQKSVMTIQKKLSNAWYWLMKPINLYYSTERENAKYNKKKDKITEEQAIKWVAESMAKYLVRNSQSKMNILVAEYFNREDFWGYESLSYIESHKMRNDKARMAYHKYKWTVERQLKIIAALEAMTGIQVTKEEVEISWRKVTDYQGVYVIEYIG